MKYDEDDKKCKEMEMDSVEADEQAEDSDHEEESNSNQDMGDSSKEESDDGEGSGGEEKMELAASEVVDKKADKGRRSDEAGSSSTFSINLLH